MFNQSSQVLLNHQYSSFSDLLLDMKMEIVSLIKTLVCLKLSCNSCLRIREFIESFEGTTMNMLI